MLVFISHPSDAVRVGDYLNIGLANPAWREFRAAVAFVKRSGVKHIRDALSSFSANPANTVRIAFGVDKGITSLEGAMDLLTAIGRTGEAYAFQNHDAFFHPKVYLFKNNEKAEAFVGSTNLTQGGLYENYEASVRISLDLRQPEDKKLLKKIERELDLWSTPGRKLCFRLTPTLIGKLVSSGYLPTEEQSRKADASAQKAISSRTKGKSPFGRVSVQRAPRVSSPTPAGKGVPKVKGTTRAPITSQPTPSHLKFGMLLQRTDVSMGQVSTGTQKRSPEIFIPILALDLNPSFWGWSDHITPDSSRYLVDSVWAKKIGNKNWIQEQRKKVRSVFRPLHKLDWGNVKIKLKGQPKLLDASFWFNPRKKDIRIRNSVLRSCGRRNDILVMWQAPDGSAYDYGADVIKKSDARYAKTKANLSFKVRNSKKLVGYF